MPGGRLAHNALLTGLVLVLTLPNLGATSLWDVDEGVNAGCTREMMEAGTWVVPTFNWELRTAKPVMLYWLQRISFLLFDISEWSARLPAVVCSLGTVLLIYDLGRRMFGASTGLLGGIVLASAIEFCKLAHAATPDAPLILFTTLTFYLFWVGHENGGRSWFYTASVASGLAVLTKGPVGLALPGLVVLLDFFWNRELRRLLDIRLIRGILLFLLVAAPWYVLVISETRGAYLAFFKNENANRFLNPMEGHRGPIVYYLGALLLFFAPWCIFLGGTFWYAIKHARQQAGPDRDDTLSTETRANRFLLCWIGSYLVFFSIAATKLPNYIAPLYPALALLTARFLILWRDAAIVPARWFMPAACLCMMIVGVCVTVGVLIAGGTIPVSTKGMRIIPELSKWAILGAIPMLGAGVMIWRYAINDRIGFVNSVAVTSVAFVASLAAFPIVEVDRYKAPKSLVEESGARQRDREIRLASLDYTQPSVTFYAERAVERLTSAEAARTFLAMPLPAYLFVPEPVWSTQLQGPLSVSCRIAARRYDFYRNCDILVISNEGTRP